MTTRMHTIARHARQAAKPIKFHAAFCPFPRTATCTCGREPEYSPGKRLARGEINANGSVRSLEAK